MSGRGRGRGGGREGRAGEMYRVFNHWVSGRKTLLFVAESAAIAAACATGAVMLERVFATEGMTSRTHPEMVTGTCWCSSRRASWRCTRRRSTSWTSTTSGSRRRTAGAAHGWSRALGLPPSDGDGSHRAPHPSAGGRGAGRRVRRHPRSHRRPRHAGQCARPTRAGSSWSVTAHASSGCSSSSRMPRRPSRWRRWWIRAGSAPDGRESCWRWRAGPGPRRSSSRRSPDRSRPPRRTSHGAATRGCGSTGPPSTASASFAASRCTCWTACSSRPPTS